MVDYEEVSERLFDRYVEPELNGERILPQNMLSRISRIEDIRPLPPRLKEILSQSIVDNHPEIVSIIEGPVEVMRTTGKKLTIVERNLILVQQAARDKIAVPEAVVKRVPVLIDDIRLERSAKTNSSSLVFIIGEKRFTLNQLRREFKAKMK